MIATKKATLITLSDLNLDFLDLISKKYFLMT